MFTINIYTVCVSALLIKEIKRIIKESEIMKCVVQIPSKLGLCWTLAREDDTKWPPRDKDGRQELEIRLGNEHISFEV